MNHKILTLSLLSAFAFGCQAGSDENTSNIKGEGPEAIELVQPGVFKVVTPIDAGCEQVYQVTVKKNDLRFKSHQGLLTLDIEDRCGEEPKKYTIDYLADASVEEYQSVMYVPIEDVPVEFFEHRRRLADDKDSDGELNYFEIDYKVNEVEAQ